MSKYDEALKAINRMYSDLTSRPRATLELCGICVARSTT